MVLKQRSGKKRSRNEEAYRQATNELYKLQEATERSLGGKKARERLKYALAVLGLALLAGMLLNWFDPSDPTIHRYFSAVCKVATCDPAVWLKHRRFVVKRRPVKPGEQIFSIPREVQIWDLDALRNKFVQSALFGASHERTNNTLPSAAFLAAYISLAQSNISSLKFESVKGHEMTNLHRSYLQTLPTKDELRDHPIFWSPHELQDSLDRHSSSFSVARTYQEMVESEYRAFAHQSAAFKSYVDEDDYKLSRIHVLSRSFNPGPVTHDMSLLENTSERFSGWEEESKMYLDRVGINFTEGCHALVPLLDMLNHHPSPNVRYAYEEKSKAFVINAVHPIPTGWEVMDSYGKYTDQHLFSKFGFVNGDGSGYTQASIALYHRVIDNSFKKEYNYLPNVVPPARGILNMLRKQMKLYLQFDDGYEKCIEGPDDQTAAFSLKRLKLMHLAQIADNSTRWTVNLSPRWPSVSPGESTVVPNIGKAPSFDPEKLKLNLGPVLSTCRLISLTVEDFEYKAMFELQRNVGNFNFVVEQGSDALEYRSLMCIGRLASMALHQFQGYTSVEDEMKKVESLVFRSREWTIGHIRLGEIQSLHTISAIVFSRARRMEELGKVDKSKPSFQMRNKPCPANFLDALV